MDKKNQKKINAKKRRLFSRKESNDDNNNVEKFDVAILGAGQTGLTLAKYLIKKQFNVLVIDKQDPGIKNSLDLKNFNKLSQRFKEFPDQKQDFFKLLQKRLVNINVEQNKELFSQIHNNSYFTFVKGEVKNIDEYTLEVNSKKYRFKKLVFATGSYYKTPTDIPNLERNMYFNLDEIRNINQPYNSIAIYGTNIEALELANAFANLGTNVYLFDENVNPFNNFDDELEALLKTMFHPDLIRWNLESKITNHSYTQDKHIKIEYESQSTNKFLEVEKIFITNNKVSETRNIDAFFNIPTNKKDSFIINNSFRIKDNPNFYAIGDANGIQMMPSQANIQAIQLARLICGESNLKYNPYNLALSIDIEPEFAFYGMNKHDLEYLGLDFNEFTFSFDYELNSKLFDHKSKLKVYTNKKHEILGIFLYGHKISQLLPMFILATNYKIKFHKLANTNFPFYTKAEAIRDAAIDYELEFVGLSKQLKRIQKRKNKKGE